MKITRLFLPFLLCFGTIFCVQETTSNLTTDFLITSLENYDMQNVLSKITSLGKTNNDTLQKISTMTIAHTDKLAPFNLKDENPFRRKTKKELYQELFQKKYSDAHFFHDELVLDFSVETSFIIIESVFTLSRIDYIDLRRNTKNSPIIEEGEQTESLLMKRLDKPLKSNLSKADEEYSKCKYAKREVVLVNEKTNEYHSVTEQVLGQCTTKMPIDIFKKKIERYHQKKEDNKKYWFSRYLPSW